MVKKQKHRVKIKTTIFRSPMTFWKRLSHDNKTFKSKRKEAYRPPHQREAPREDFDARCKAYREEPSRSKSRKDESRECTFQPNTPSNNSSILRRKPSKDIMCRIDEMNQWLQESRHKNAANQLTRLINECTFKPSINKKSENLAVIYS